MRIRLELEALEQRVTCDANSNGPNGIASLALNLTGQNINIGQVAAHKGDAALFS